jgi:hypothetical protein
MAASKAHIKMRSLEGLRHSYEYKLRQIVRAYEASCASFNEDIDNIGRWPASKPLLMTNDDYQDTFDYLAHLHYEADTSIALIREAFTLALFHYWEKCGQSWLRTPGYRFKKSNTRLTDSGDYVADYETLDLMRMVANTVKHQSAELWKNYPEMFSPLVAHYLEDGFIPPYADLIRLTDEHMKRFITALWNSGPNAKSKAVF